MSHLVEDRDPEDSDDWGHPMIGDRSNMINALSQGNVLLTGERLVIRSLLGEIEPTSWTNLKGGMNPP
jgi:hypothetical protein